MLKWIDHNKFRLFLLTVYVIGIASIWIGITTNPFLLLYSYIWYKIILMIGHNIGMHRLFSHKSFNPSKIADYIITGFSVLVGVGSPIQYARNHRYHHRNSDNEKDWHSPHTTNPLMIIFGLWQFHDLSWFLSRGGSMPRDLIKNKKYLFVHNHYYKIWGLLALITLLINWKITFFFLFLPSFYWHIEIGILVNYMAHKFGYRNFETPDNSTNVRWSQYLMLGETLHNNHHGKPNLCNFAVTKGEFDFSGWFAEKFLTAK